MKCLFVLTVATTLFVTDASAIAIGPSLSGHVVDEGGNPLAGARVDISTAAPRTGRSVFCPSCYLDCRKSARSAEDGSFSIPLTDATLKFRLLVSMPGRRTVQTELLDPALEQPTIPLEPARTDWPEDLTVRGVVLNEQGVPVEGALVDPAGAKTADRRWFGKVDLECVVSDASGEFELFLPAGYTGVDVEILADGYAGMTTEDILVPGKLHRLTIPTGTSVSGQVLNDGLPLSGFTVAVVQVNRLLPSHFIASVAAETGVDGRFEFAHLPSDQPYVIYSLVGDGTADFVLPTTSFSAGASGAHVNLGELSLIPALRLSGRIDIPTGTQLPEDARLVVQRDPAWDLVSTAVQPDGTFSIGGLAPEAIGIHLSIPGLTLDTRRNPYQTLQGDAFGMRLVESKSELEIPVVQVNQSEANQPAEVGENLQTMVPLDQFVQGIIVDPGGSPVAGVQIGVSSRRSSPRQVCETDSEGRFELQDLPEASLELIFFREDYRGGRIYYPGYATVSPGETDIRIVYDPTLSGFIDELGITSQR